jgi:hypothetical protein
MRPGCRLEATDIGRPAATDIGASETISCEPLALERCLFIKNTPIATAAALIIAIPPAETPAMHAVLQPAPLLIVPVAVTPEAVIPAPLLVEMPELDDEPDPIAEVVIVVLGVVPMLVGVFDPVTVLVPLCVDVPDPVAELVVKHPVTGNIVTSFEP